MDPVSRTAENGNNTGDKEVREMGIEICRRTGRGDLMLEADPLVQSRFLVEAACSKASCSSSAKSGRAITPTVRVGNYQRTDSLISLRSKAGALLLCVLPYQPGNASFSLQELKHCKSLFPFTVRLSGLLKGCGCWPWLPRDHDPSALRPGRDSFKIAWSIYVAGFRGSTSTPSPGHEKVGGQNTVRSRDRGDQRLYRSINQYTAGD